MCPCLQLFINTLVTSKRIKAYIYVTHHNKEVPGILNNIDDVTNVYLQQTQAIGLSIHLNELLHYTLWLTTGLV